MQPTKTSWWVEPGVLLAGPAPRTQDRDYIVRDLRALLDASIRVFVDLREMGEMFSGGEATSYEPVLRQLDPLATVICHPMMDGSALPVEKLDAIVDEINAQTKLVYVHCHGGIGRTG